ncbi:chitooligosaccharide deacetylase [Cohnella kolymensis]|uniref:Chitooligosaccharide deacetylase n=1 Tax=Cohnella kolymensis TaxID=1590652 RepID=A0ABR5A343_9BACL|nr:polysaccharide deacetylase family protein [Cohnella kolymensis]KIL35460.1 chitooligosaccharide deacetylase [Cohnella kolymensis]
MKTWCRIVFVLALCLNSACAQNDGDQSKHEDHRQHSRQINKSRQDETPDLADGPEGAVRRPHPMSLADLHSKYPSTFVLQGPRRKREVALTFDDAPDNNFTPRILDVLKKEGVSATFFVVGNRVQAHPDVVMRMVREGHQLGNHTYNHANLLKLSDQAFRREIMKTDSLISQYTGYIPTYVRAPYGNVNEDQLRWLASRHKINVFWDVDSLDWKGLSAEQVQTNVLAHVHPGSIILQHAAGGKGEDLSGTVNALSSIINQLRNDGVKLVTVSELLDNH